MIVDLITMETPDGVAEARRDGPQSQWWDISFPTGDVRSHGTKSQIEALMRRRIAADYPLGEDAP